MTDWLAFFGIWLALWIAYKFHDLVEHICTHGLEPDPVRQKAWDEKHRAKARKKQN